MQKEQEIMYTIRRRKLEYLGHHHHEKSLLQSIMQGKLKGKRGPDRRRTSWLEVQPHGTLEPGSEKPHPNCFEPPPTKL